MDSYTIEGNKDLARDPETNAVVNVNTMEHQNYVHMRRTKTRRNKTNEEDLDNLKGEINEIKSLLKELVNGN